MTGWEALALAFPVLAGGGVVLTTYIAKRIWIDPRPEVRPVPKEAATPEDAATEEAVRAMREAAAATAEAVRKRQAAGESESQAAVAVGAKDEILRLIEEIIHEARRLGEVAKHPAP